MTNTGQSGAITLNTVVDTGLSIGQRIKEFRQAKGYSLSALSEKTGISDTTLSRVENSVTPISAHNLYILSQVLEVDITAFYKASSNPIRQGIRSVSRQGESHQIQTQRYTSNVFASDLANKKMHPALNVVDKRSLKEVGGLAAHSGEEFLLVIRGRLDFRSEFYEPLLLEVGDSVYFDGNMAHAYLSADDTAAEILVITSLESNPEQSRKTQ